MTWDMWVWDKEQEPDIRLAQDTSHQGTVRAGKAGIRRHPLCTSYYQ
jgi:hypothetical protein